VLESEKRTSTPKLSRGAVFFSAGGASAGIGTVALESRLSSPGTALAMDALDFRGGMVVAVRKEVDVLGVVIELVRMWESLTVVWIVLGVQCVLRV
jgi:hypothetical protein